MNRHTRSETQRHTRSFSPFPSLINCRLIKSLFIKLALCALSLSLPRSAVIPGPYRTHSLPQPRTLHAICSARRRRAATRRGVKTGSLSLSLSLAHFGRFIRSPLHREINLIAGESRGAPGGRGGGYAEADPITPPSTLTPPPSLHIQSAHV